jgi:hypothetical protein
MLTLYRQEEKHRDPESGGPFVGRIVPRDNIQTRQQSLFWMSVAQTIIKTLPATPLRAPRSSCGARFFMSVA